MSNIHHYNQWQRYGRWLPAYVPAEHRYPDPPLPEPEVTDLGDGLVLREYGERRASIRLQADGLDVTIDSWSHAGTVSKDNWLRRVREDRAAALECGGGKCAGCFLNYVCGATVRAYVRMAEYL